jgi:hypothetical protein
MMLGGDEGVTADGTLGASNVLQDVCCTQGCHKLLSWQAVSTCHGVWIHSWPVLHVCLVFILAGCCVGGLSFQGLLPPMHLDVTWNGLCMPPSACFQGVSLVALCCPGTGMPTIAVLTNVQCCVFCARLSACSAIVYRLIHTCAQPAMHFQDFSCC